MKTTEIRGNSVLLLGYGREGKSMHRWLAKHYPEVRVGIADRTVAPELMPGGSYGGATVHSGEGYLFHLHEYDTVVRSPGISPYIPEVAEFVRGGGYITSATNIFFSLVSGTTIGITGTKGKSTTSSLIAHVLSSAYPDVRLVGNIGNPMLESLEGATDKTVFVIELSSHQLYDCRYSPHIAVMLGIVSEHLDYYPDFASYANAKANIVRFQKSTDTLVFNPTHTFVRELVRNSNAAKAVYGRRPRTSAHTYIKAGVITVRENGKESPVIPLTDVPLLGNVENILAAITVCDLMRVPVPLIAKAIAPFKSLPHRLEYVGEYGGIRFYNDSLATIPQATVHALQALGSDVETLIAGGYDRHLDYAELGAYLRSHPVKTLILFPDTGDRIWSSIGHVTKAAGEAGIMEKYSVSTMEEAVRIAHAHTAKGKICLLSPASASYNLFRDYADRGEQFAYYARKLGS